MPWCWSGGALWRRIACSSLARSCRASPISTTSIRSNWNRRSRWLSYRRAPIPAEAALVVLPGSKATIADLAALREFGWDIDIAAHRRRGGAILGLCGGYQMLGRVVADPLGIEGPPGAVAGLGLLDVETELRPLKALRRVSGRAWGAGFLGYEMHMGVTTGPDAARPFARLDDGENDGAVSADGRVIATYCHGLLASTELRAALLARVGAASRGEDYAAGVEAALDEIAEEVERDVDVDGLLGLARTGGN